LLPESHVCEEQQLTALGRVTALLFLECLWRSPMLSSLT
jgi:hypothetical protein